MPSRSILHAAWLHIRLFDSSARINVSRIDRIRNCYAFRLLLHLECVPCTLHARAVLLLLLLLLSLSDLDCQLRPYHHSRRSVFELILSCPVDQLFT